MSEVLSPEKCQGLILEQISQWEDEVAHTIHPQFRQAIQSLVTPDNYTPGLVNFLLYTVSTKTIFPNGDRKFAHVIRGAMSERFSSSTLETVMRILASGEEDFFEEDLNPENVEENNPWRDAIELGLRLQIVHQSEDQTLTLDPQVERLFFPKSLS